MKIIPNNGPVFRLVRKNCPECKAKCLFHPTHKIGEKHTKDWSRVECSSCNSRFELTVELLPSVVFKKIRCREKYDIISSDY